MDVQPLALPGLVLITAKRFEDQRGYFSETWNRRALAAHGIEIDFVQDNQSMSVTSGTLRGLHFQTPPAAQGKMVRVLRGRIFDVAVDLRRGSPTFGKWCGVELTAETGEQLLVPPGFAHGFVTLEPRTEIFYKVDAFYAPDCDKGIAWNDPDIGIEWPWAAEPVLSDKDTKLPRLAEIESPFVYAG